MESQKETTSATSNSTVSAANGGHHPCIEIKLPLRDAATTFNLEKAVCSHGLFMMAPNYWDPISKTLQRSLRLSLDFNDHDYETSLLVSISQTSDSPHALQLRVFGTDTLSSIQEQALLAQVRRMLRLSKEENQIVTEFQEVYADAKARGFGRVFRSPTLFEDMIKCILLCNCQWSRTLSMARALCELQFELQSDGINFGNHVAKTEYFIPKTPIKKDSKIKRKCSKSSAITFEEIKAPIESNLNSGNVSELFQDGKVVSLMEIGNFPSPKELAKVDENFLGKRCGLGYRAKRIVSLARSVVEGRIQLNEFEEVCDKPSLSKYEKLAEQLKEINGFGPFTCANVLMCMGFYHVIPTDSETIRHLKQVHARNSTIRTIQTEVELIYGKYAPYQFLVYWCEVWHFYEEWFGKLSEMPHTNYKLITASNMNPKNKRIKTSLIKKDISS